MAAPDAFINGLETGALSAEGAATGSVAIEASVVRTGSYSVKLTPASGAAGYWEPRQESPARTLRFYLRVTSLPSTARLLLGTSAAGQANLVLNPSGTVAYRYATTTIGTSSTALTDTATWYQMEVNVGINGSSIALLRIDGTDQVTGDIAQAASVFGVGTSMFGANDTVAATYTAYVDDIAGKSGVQADVWVGAGQAVLLRPTSLSAAGGWVEGDGAGTAGMAAAVATRPPPGLASANETSATNIESPTNSATDNCDMNMTTYSAAGVGASDTINAVQAVIRHGEDIAVGTKGGASLIVSNPTQSPEDTFNYGNDGGAHGAEPGFWYTAIGTAQTSPSVTLGTAPVLRVGKRTATTRVVCVDFMGIYVDYSPAVTTAVSLPNIQHLPFIPKGRSL